LFSLAIPPKKIHDLLKIRDTREAVLSFIKELMRRNVIRVMVSYAVAAWLLVQGMDVLTDTFDAPPWVMKVFIGMVMLGILPAMVLSWVYEITPEGIKKDATDLPAHEPGSVRKLDIAVLVMLTVAIGIFVAEKYIGDDSVTSSPAEGSASVREGPPMLAVLPFASKSLGGDSEFFASGVHDDLLTQLAQLQSIRVISRTSVLEYQDTVRNIREIGRELGADAILEGGVQSAGNRIRINAQLIDAQTDEHMWAQTYDRELSAANIFDVQTEIARAITSALQATMTVRDATQLSVLPTENMAAYRAYHRALEIRDEPTGAFDTKAFRESLEEAVALDPTFTRAWAELAGILSFENFGEQDADSIQRAEQVLEQIRTLAPKSADYLIAQSYYTYYILKNYDRAYQLITQAQEMTPSDARLVELKSWIQRRLGDFEGKVESERLARTLDPRNPRWTQGMVRTLIVSHRYEDARREIENSSFHDYGLSTWYNVLQLKERRNFGRWAEDQAAIHREFEDVAEAQDLWDAYIAARDYAAAEKLLSSMQEPNTGMALRGSLSARRAIQIVTYWFLQESDRLTELLAEARTIIDEGRDADGNFRHYNSNLDMALVTAAEGNTKETERLIRRWRRGVAKDLAELANTRHLTCQLLGMAGATAAAVECIQSSLAEPSFTMPFMEPFLPYYDSIRDEPEFVDLLAGLADVTNNS
jgi:TolB-like protein/Tfp pilus assembly protein PilF